jgi:hypothetical protein
MKFIEITQSGDFQDITINENADDFIILNMLKFNGEPKKATWQIDCGFYMINKSYPRASFPGFVNGSLGCDLDKIPSKVAGVMSNDGEFLEIAIDQLACFNVTNVVDCVDREKTVWAPVVGGGEPYRFNKVVFDANKAPINRMFHLPKWTSKIYYLLDDEDQSYEESFYKLYHQEKLTGLAFIDA